MVKTIQIREIIGKIQSRIDELYSKEPNNKTFQQEGMINGSKIVQSYLHESEFGITIEHLLYMVYESDIVYPNEVIKELNELASEFKIENPYL